MGNIAAHASQAHAHLAGVGVLRHQLVQGTATNVQIDAPHHHRIGGGTDDVALAGDVPLLHQVGDMYRRRRPGDARLVRQLLLGDHRVLLDPFQDLPLPLGHGTPPKLLSTF